MMAKVRELAHGGTYKVMETEQGIYIQGLGNNVHYFPRDKWDQFAEVIAYADLKLRGHIE